MSYISTAGDMKFDDTLKRFVDPNIYVVGTYYQELEQWRVTLSVREETSFVPSNYEHTMMLTKAEVDAETGSGTGDTAKCQNALEQAVVTYLEVLNGAIFTIN